MKFASAIVGASTFIAASSSLACTISAAHMPIVLGDVTGGKVVSRMLGELGEIKGNDVYNNQHQLVGTVDRREVKHANGSFAAFVTFGQILNSERQVVATISSCTPTEAGAAYLLMFH